MTLAIQRARSGREPFIICRLYLDVCSRVFGTGLCLATGEACYQTIAGCKYINAYDKTTQVHTFCSARVSIPTELLGAIPCIYDYSITPSRIDPNGSIGARGVASVTFRDFLHNDVGVDPYVSTRAYDPMVQGTFFGRLRARNLYYTGRKMEIDVGYLDEAGNYDPANFRTFTYFIESLDGPMRDGEFSVTGKDILKYFDDVRAVAPPANSGKLLNDITVVQTSAVLTPGGIGALEYAASGMLAIGSELCTFTRSGDNLTLVRGVNGTEAAAHDADDTVQQCEVITSQTAQNIAYHLSTNRASVPITYIPKAEWDQEQIDYLPRLYSAVIAQPTGVRALMNSLLEETGTMMWWDEESALLRFRAIRPLSDDPVKSIGEIEHIVGNSLDIKDEPNARVSRVFVYYGILNPTKSLTDGSNFKLRHIEADGGAESANLYGSQRIKTIYSRWITEQNAVAAIDLGEKLLYRFRRGPRRVSFILDEKDGDLKPGDFTQISSVRCQKMNGESDPVNAQMLSRKFTNTGHQVRYDGVEFFYLAPQIGPSGQVERTIVIVTDALNVNLRALHDAIYADLNDGDVVRFKLLGGVHIGSISTSQYAMISGSWPAGVDVYLDLYGDCVIGGPGGAGATVALSGTVQNGVFSANSVITIGAITAGQNGGPALLFTSPISLSAIPATEPSGYVRHPLIAGGAGGGGAVDAGFTYSGRAYRWFAAGGGGSTAARNNTRAVPGVSFIRNYVSGQTMPFWYDPAINWYSDRPAHQASLDGSNTYPYDQRTIGTPGQGAFMRQTGASYITRGGNGGGVLVPDSHPTVSPTPPTVKAPTVGGAGAQFVVGANTPPNGDWTPGVGTAQFATGYATGSMGNAITGTSFVTWLTATADIIGPTSA